MAKFQLAEGEKLIGSATMAFVEKATVGSRAGQGKLYVTNQRVCFHMSMLGTVLMEEKLSDIGGYAEGRQGLFIKALLIHAKGNTFKFTGMGRKKVMGWLDQAGVQKM